MNALNAARALPVDELPPLRAPNGGPPPVNRWTDRDPAAAVRLTAARAALVAIAERHRLPLQNLLSPDLVRRLCWEPPEPLDAATIEGELLAGGARHWQRDLTVHSLTTALSTPAGSVPPTRLGDAPSR